MSLFFDFHHESRLVVVGELLRLGKALEPSFISIPSGAPGIGKSSLNFGKITSVEPEFALRYVPWCMCILPKQGSPGLREREGAGSVRPHLQPKVEGSLAPRSSCPAHLSTSLSTCAVHVGDRELILCWLWSSRNQPSPLCLVQILGD